MRLGGDGVEADRAHDATVAVFLALLAWLCKPDVQGCKTKDRHRLKERADNHHHKPMLVQVIMTSFSPLNLEASEHKSKIQN